MAEIEIRDAKDVVSGDQFYFTGHAAATFMSDGESVESAIKTLREGLKNENSDRIKFDYSEYPSITFKQYKLSEDGMDENPLYFICATHNDKMWLGASGSDVSIDVSGNLEANGFYQTSDATKKDIIENVNVDVNNIAEAPLVKFTYKEKDDTVHVGTIAQYWKEVLPEVVNGEEGNYTVDYATLATVNSIQLAKVVVKQQKQIDDLREELNKLKELVCQQEK